MGPGRSRAARSGAPASHALLLASCARAAGPAASRLLLTKGFAEAFPGRAPGRGCAGRPSPELSLPPGQVVGRSLDGFGGVAKQAPGPRAAVLRGCPRLLPGAEGVKAGARAEPRHVVRAAEPAGRRSSAHPRRRCGRGRRWWSSTWVRPGRGRRETRLVHALHARSVHTSSAAARVASLQPGRRGGGVVQTPLQMRAARPADRAGVAVQGGRAAAPKAGEAGPASSWSQGLLPALGCSWVMLSLLLSSADYTLWPFWVDTHVEPPFQKSR